MRLASLLVIAIPTICFSVIFGDALFADRRLAFRDISHFYQPLLQYLHQRLGTGELPLWNPLDQFGIPVAGESSTAIFYPGNAIFHLGLNIERSLAWFVALHLLLAAVGLYWVLRQRRYNRTASLIAAISYAFSGPVLFLYCNPPFLVGAAWLPLAFGCLYCVIDSADKHPDRNGRSLSRRQAIAIGSAASAMMIAGGDVQTVGHVFLILAATLLYRALKNGIRLRSFKPAIGFRNGGVLRSLSPLLIAGLLTALMASIQLLPSIHWSRQSVRHHSPSPGIARWMNRSPNLNESFEWWKAPPAGSHPAAVYDFSIPPWQWLGIFIPHVAGDLFPTNTRITRLLPGEGRVWTPSLFIGLVPAICLMHRLCNLRRRRLQIWDGLIAAGLLFSLGKYGLVWAAAEVVYLLTGRLIFDGLNEAIGGPYWLLVSTVVGYSDFRFPGKWLIFFCLGSGWLTADSLSRFARRNLKSWLVPASLIAAFSGMLFLLSLLIDSSLATDKARTSDPLFGPLDVPAAIAQVRWATGYVCLAMALIVLALLRCPDAKRYLPIAFVLLTACELTVHGRQIVGKSQSLQGDKAASVTNDLSLKRLVALTPRQRWPSEWQQTSSAQRIERVELAQRASLFMRWHLSEDIAKLNSVVSLRHWRSFLFWQAVQESLAELPASERSAAIQRTCRLVGAQGTIEPTVSTVANVRKGFNRAFAAKDSVAADSVEDEAFVVDLHARIRIPEAEMITCVSDYRVVDPAQPTAQLQQTIADQIKGIAAHSILESRHNALNDQATIHPPTIHPPTIHPHLPAAIRSSEATCAIRTLSAQHIAAKVNCQHQVLLKFFQLQDGFWTARYRNPTDDRWRQATSESVDVVSQGFQLPAGTWEVEFQYAPKWYVPGFTLSIIGWTIAFLLLVPSRALKRYRSSAR